MNLKPPFIIGIDVGGSKILLQTFDKAMNLLAEKKVKTEVKKGKQGFTEQLITLISRYFQPSVKGIGIAVPGIVHKEKGRLIDAPHLPTGRDYPVKKILEKVFKVPVTVDNDINAFLIAEKERPALKKYKNIVAVMVGTGTGGAIMNDGQLIYGALGYAGEVGHMITCEGCRFDTFEKNTSGHYLPKISKNKAQAKKHLLKHMGIGLSNLNLIFNPEVIVLGGSVYYYHLAKDKAKLRRFIAEKAMDKKSPLLLDAGKRTSVAHGAALMVYRKHKI